MSLKAYQMLKDCRMLGHDLTLVYYKAVDIKRVTCKQQQLYELWMCCIKGLGHFSGPNNDYEV